MKHLKTLYKRYFAETATSGAYISMTIIYLVLIAIGFNIGNIVDYFGSDETQVWRYVLVDETASQSGQILEQIPPQEGADALVFANEAVLEGVVPGDFLETIRAGEAADLSPEALDQLETAFDDEAIRGIVRIYDHDDGNLGVQIYSPDSLSLTDQMTLQGLFDQINRQLLIIESNLPEEDLARILNAGVVLEEMDVGLTGEETRTADELNAGMAVSYGISFVVFFMSLMFSSTLATAIATEKSSRVMEVIVTSVTPRAHLLGRVLAALSAAFLQVAILLGFAYLMIVVSGSEMQAQVNTIIEHVRAEFLILALLLMLVTIAQYLLLAALLGSLVNSPEEASQAVAPLSLLLVGGFYISLAGLFNPELQLLTVTSFFPFLSAMVMPMRIGASTVPMVQGWIALGINVGFLVLLYFITAAVYRGAVITYRTGGLLQKLKGAWSLRS